MTKKKYKNNISASREIWMIYWRSLSPKERKILLIITKLLKRWIKKI